MALTRKMLAAMDIPAEKIDEIIAAHAETVNAIKEERDALKSDADQVKSLKEKLDAANEELKTLKSGDWEKKYSDLKAEYDGFKKDTAEKATKKAKEDAYKKLLTDAGISSKRIDSVMKVSAPDIDKLEIGEDGKIKDADKLIEGVKKDWADFISTEGTKGADTHTPPAGTGGDDNKLSRAAELAAKFNKDRYGIGKEN